MSRPIQFRQWSEKFQRFYYWGYGLGKYGLPIRGDNPEMFFTHPLLKVTSEQFTGLYDKNGEKIWEGDIVEVDDYSGGAVFGMPQPRKKIVVSFSKRGYIGFKSGFTIDKSDRNPVVLGNIHQNPELLKGGENG